jgi:hypothetical protein
MPRPVCWILLCGIAILLTFPPSGSSALSLPPTLPGDFPEATLQGFGDRQNSGVWSMQWWRGKLYVGTVRSWFCFSQAWFHQTSRVVPYPPVDPDFDCAADPLDLPLQAEIWRYTPESRTWERVYRSPNDVPIPGYPGKFTSRDMGFRSMTVFRETDGTEALYVGGTTSYALWQGVPPPRILRSVDGVHFEPLPQTPGTVLGDLGMNQTSFRDMETYRNRLYVINGRVQGQGTVMESADPAAGDDTFRWVTPQDMLVFEILPYNGYLYVGLTDRANGYAVLKTDAAGEPPYRFTPVVTNGAHLTRPSPSVVSMHVFDGRLYVGTDQPCEIIRINPDDSWDLIVGTSRLTPDGWKYPLSGLDAGFDWPLTQHMWRMQAHEGTLYVGTNDPTLRLAKALPGLDPQLSWQYGFDLYASSDGEHFRPITVNAFGDKFQVGIRGFATTPYGLFVGDVSFWYGLRVYLGNGQVRRMYLPLVLATAGRPRGATAGSVPIGPIPAGDWPGFMAAPPELAAELANGRALLYWERPAAGARFRVYRSEFTSNRQLGIPGLEPDAWMPGPFAEIGITGDDYFLDSSLPDGWPCQYYVVAETDWGRGSPASNLVRVPSLVPAESFHGVLKALYDLRSPAATAAAGADQNAIDRVLAARRLLHASQPELALAEIDQLRTLVCDEQVDEVASWRARDLERSLARLARRVRLVGAGLIAAEDLD